MLHTSKPNMNDLLILSTLTDEQYKEISSLWEITGVANPARGDSLDAVNKTLEHGAKILLLYKENRPIGTVWLTHDFRRLYIHHMAVHPSFQNQGWGRMLLKEALKIASEMKLQAKLEVRSDNYPALHLYSSEGFEPLEGYQTLIKRKV